jgi:hypothetical protein
MNRDTLPFCALFAAVFGLCYPAASWVTARHGSLPAWDLPFERAVPFVPGMAVVYLTIIPVLLLAPFVLRTRAALAPFALTLCVETLIASVLFVLFPQTVAWTRPVVTGWARIPFSAADALNLQYNQFPSLHVAFACSTAWVYSRRTRYGAGWLLWAGAVVVSTWLMWEHHLADIGGGIALAVFGMAVVHPRLRAPGVELQCLWQCVRFSRRHPRYFVIFLAIYAPSLLHWRRYRAVRTGFCAAQWIDDLLDGDRRSAREPLEVVDALLEEMSTRTFSREPLSRLVAALFDDLDETAQLEFIALVRCMRVDRERVLAQARWPEEELNRHHWTTFRHSVNLMLITAGCAARACEVPSLVRALAWCSVFRDLDDDLRKGLVNIPRDADRDRWTRQCHTRAREVLRDSAREVQALGDERARRLLGVFQRSIERFWRRTALGDGPDSESEPLPIAPDQGSLRAQRGGHPGSP